MEVRLKITLAIGVCLLVAGNASADDTYALQTDHFRLYYPAGRTDKADVVAEAAEQALDPLSHSMDVEINDRIRIELFNTRTAMFESAGLKIRPGVMGLALTGQNRILLGIVDDTSLARTTVHELAHIILHRKFGEYGVHGQPRWLHEGFAQLGAGELTTAQQQALGEAAVAGELMTIDELEKAFHGDSEAVSLAYAQSFTLVRHLHELRPKGGLAEFVENLSETEDLNRAMIRTYGMTKATIEEKWLKGIRGEYISAGLEGWWNTAIFGGMAFIFVIVVIIQSRRRAAIRERMQEQEEQMAQIVDGDEGAQQ